MLHASPSEVHRSRFLETCGRVCGWHVAYVLHPSYFLLQISRFTTLAPSQSDTYMFLCWQEIKKQSFALAGQIKKKQTY